MKHLGKVSASVVIAGAAVGIVAGCSTGTATKVTPQTTPPATSLPSQSANVGNLGTTFKVSDDTTGPHYDATAVYTVKASDVTDPAASDNPYDGAPAGQHLVAVEFVINGVTGQESTDANAITAVQGSNGQVYQPNLGGVAIGTNFDSGDFTATPGSSVTGWVSFAVPNGIAVANVQWTAAGTGTVTWTVGK